MKKSCLSFKALSGSAARFLQIGIRSETQEKQWAPAVPFDAASLPLPEKPDADGAKRIFDRFKAEGLTGETLTFNEEGAARCVLRCVCTEGG